MVRTQVYLTKRQHRAIKKVASRESVSMTAMLRRIIDGHLEGLSGVKGFQKESVMSFIGLGASARRHTSERHDDALDKAIRGGALR